MRRARYFFLFAIILTLGLVAVAVVWFKFLQPSATPVVAEATPTPVVDLVKVVIVTQHIPRGAKLDETVLGMIDIQRDLLFEGYFTDIAEVVGRQARLDLEANMLLTKSMVVDSSAQLSGTGSLAALSIPKGMVAVSIPISRLSSVSYAPQSGDHVNVIVTLLMADLDTDFQTILPNRASAVMSAGPGILIGSGTGDEGSAAVDKDLNKVTAQNVSGGPFSVIGRAEIDPVLEQTFYAIPSEPQRPRLVSQSLLQDVVVLGVGELKEKEPTAVETPVTPIGTEMPTEEAPSNLQVEEAVPTEEPLPDVISLIVSPQDAVTLNYLIYSGAQLTLALRPATDDTRVQTEAATLDFLLKQYNIPVPVKLPYGMEPKVSELARPTLANDVQPTPQP